MHSLLQSNETIGYILLRNIGVKDKAIELKASLNSSNDDEDDSDVTNKKFPTAKVNELYKEYLKNPKHNTFGIGYVGLQKTHVPTFSSSNLTLLNKKHDKKLTISGQAFGVGAFEEDDEDIYSKDDLSNYDFEMTTEKTAAKNKNEKVTKDLIYDSFIVASQLVITETYPPPTIPVSFVGKYKKKKSRFEPIEEEKTEENVTSRKNMNSEVRQKVWNDPQPDQNESKSNESVDNVDKNSLTESIQNSSDVDSKLDNIPGSNSLIFDRFVSEGHTSEPELSCGTQEMRDAAKMKMFGPLTRVTLSWQPCSLLCKRFNLPEPLYG